MRAAVLYGKEDVRVEEVSSPALGLGEVRMHIEAALTCGTDLKVYKRGYHARMIVPPARFGHELAGVITEVHPAAVGWSVGDRVVPANSAPCGECASCTVEQFNLCEALCFLNGAYGESIVIPARIVEKNLLRLRPETSFKAAALVEPLACVVQGLDDLKPQSGEYLLVIGAGPIGLMFVVLGKAMGLRVTAVGKGAARLEAAARLGAQRVVAAPPEAADLVTQLRGGRFDHVVEAVGRPELWEAAVQLVRKGGRVNFFGGCPSGTTVKLDTALLHYSGLHLLASFHHTPETIRRALGYIESGQIQVDDFVTAVAGLTELPGLLADMARGNRAVKTFIDVRR